MSVAKPVKTTADLLHEAGLKRTPVRVGVLEILAKERQLIDRRDDDRRKITVDVLVGDINGQPFGGGRAVCGGAVMLNELQRFVIGDSDRPAAEWAGKDSFVLGVNTLTAEALVHIVIDPVRRHGSADKISDTEARTFESGILPYHIRACQCPPQSL